MKETTHRMEEKSNCIDKKIKHTTHNTELHRNTLLKRLPTLECLVSDFIWPIVLLNVAGLKERYPKLQMLFNDLNKVLSHINSDYTTGRECSSSPLLHLNSS